MALGGSNSDELLLVMDEEARLTQAAREKLAGIVKEIERVETFQKELAGEKKDIYAVAKAAGYDAKAIRALVKRKGQDKQALEAFENVLAVYMAALDIC